MVFDTAHARPDDWLPAPARPPVPPTPAPARPPRTARRAPLHDADILAALAAGDGDRAFELLRVAYASRGYGLALRMVRDAALAEDVMQEALLQVFLGLGGLQRGASLHAWVMAIIAHRALDELRKRGRRQRQAIAVEHAELTAWTAPDGRPDLGLADRETAHALEASLATLSPKVRAAVLLRYGQDLSFEQIGDALGEIADTVRARVARALPQLRAQLAARGVAARRA